MISSAPDEPQRQKIARRRPLPILKLDTVLSSPWTDFGDDARALPILRGRAAVHMCQVTDRELRFARMRPGGELHLTPPSCLGRGSSCRTRTSATVRLSPDLRNEQSWCQLRCRACLIHPVDVGTSTVPRITTDQTRSEVNHDFGEKGDARIAWNIAARAGTTFAHSIGDGAATPRCKRNPTMKVEQGLLLTMSVAPPFFSPPVDSADVIPR
jgi:hypothetical protein